MDFDVAAVSSSVKSPQTLSQPPPGELRQTLAAPPASPTFKDKAPASVEEPIREGLDKDNLFERAKELLTMVTTKETGGEVTLQRGKHFLLPKTDQIEGTLALRLKLIPYQDDKSRDVSSGWMWQRIKSFFLNSPNKEIISSSPAPEKTKNSQPHMHKHGIRRSLGKKIVVIGVHGWFPNKFLQAIIGVPKGTSRRMVDMMTENIMEFSKELPEASSAQGLQIEGFALEGEGCIGERVSLHYKQLEEEGGFDKIRTADSVIFVAHSQGAPVTALLMKKLLSEGLLDGSKQCLGLMTLAGIHHGPFPYLKENLVVRYVEADAARELFDLNDFDSVLTKDVYLALSELLSKGVSISCVGSWLDQVVPVYSSLLVGINHPNIWRCIYIDAHNYSPDFLSALLAWILKMTNCGVPGSRELLSLLSDSLSGSLYQSNAHSTLYNDHGVYHSILNWMIRTPKNNFQASIIMDKVDHELNPFMIPWILRGILNNEKLASSGLTQGADLERLRELHSEWKPARKEWKNLKLQFAPLQSKI